MKKRLFLPILLILVGFAHRTFSQEIFIPQGAVWKYLDNGSDQGTAWRELDFDDGAWASGHAQLGYGDGDEATVVSYGPNPSRKYITTYFRRSFEVSDLSNVRNVIARLLRDDGAVVYLNGNEIIRSNMPSGTITYVTLAASTVAGSEEDIFYEFNIDPAMLNIGENVIAVEIHQRSRSSSDISFDFSLEGSATAQNLVRKAPYLIYTGNNTEYKILWQLIRTEECDLKWGTTEACSDGEATVTEYGDDHQYSYLFQNLTPRTKYYYQVIIDSAVYAGSFYSAPAENTDSLKFIVYGDNRTYPRDHNNVAHRITELFESDPEYQSVVMNVGDMVGSGESEESWDNELFDPEYVHIQKLLGSAGMQTVRGNHEGAATVLKKYFPYPYSVSSACYWSFDYGPAHFIMLDQFVSYGVGSTEYNWLVNDLETTEKNWKFIILHEPGWSAGGHGNNSTVQNVIQPLCEQYNIKIVFGGHNHYYARAEVNGVTHITTGGGGAPLYDPDPNYPNIVTTSKSHHFCKIRLSGNELDFAAIDSTGNRIDTFTLTLTDVENNSSNFPTRFSLSQNYPNPFNPTTTIKYSIPSVIASEPDLSGERGNLSNNSQNQQIVHWTLCASDALHPRNDANVRLIIYDILGRKIATLVNEKQSPGNYSVQFDASNLPSGVYFYTLRAGNYTATKKMLLLK